MKLRYVLRKSGPKFELVDRELRLGGEVVVAEVRRVPESAHGASFRVEELRRERHGCEAVHEYLQLGQRFTWGALRESVRMVCEYQARIDQLRRDDEDREALRS